MDRDKFLNDCVRTSLGYDKEAAEKYSIMPCFDNLYLSPDYDPFDMLRMQLMTDRLRTAHFGDRVKDD